MQIVYRQLYGYILRKADLTSESILLARIVMESLVLYKFLRVVPINLNKIKSIW